MKKIKSLLVFFISFCLVFSPFGGLFAVSSAGEESAGTPVSSYEELLRLITDDPYGTYYLTQDLETDFVALVPEEYRLSQELRGSLSRALEYAKQLGDTSPDPVADLERRKDFIRSSVVGALKDSGFSEAELNELFELIFRIVRSYFADEITIDEALDLCEENYSLWSARKAGLSIPGVDSIPLFGGVLNGRGHSLKGIRISAETYGSGMLQNHTNYGTFIRENRGTIKNLRLESVTATTEFTEDCGNLFFGALCGVNNGTVENVTADVDFDVIFSGSIGNGDPLAADPNRGYVGGLVGRNNGNLIDCFVTGSIRLAQESSVFYFGGITGRNSADAVICGCGNEADVREALDVRLLGDGAVLAGICGLNYGRMENCVNKGDVRLGYTGKKTYLDSSCFVAGVCASDTSKAVIRGCVNEGGVTVNNDRIKDGRMRIYVGGVISAAAGTLEDCVNRGTVSLDSVGFHFLYIGGVAANLNEGASLARCVNEGDVRGVGAQDVKTLSIEPYRIYTGGVAGFGKGVNLRYCENRGGVTGCDYTGGVFAHINNYSSSAVVFGCVNRGELYTEKSPGDSGTLIYYKLGGIAAYYAGKISQCCNFGGGHAVAPHWTDFAGLVESHGEITVTNCFNADTVFTASDSGNSVAGMTLSNRDISVSNSYNASQTLSFYRNMSEADINKLPASVFDLNRNVTAERLSDPATFKGWDFEDVWFFDETDDYPYPLLVAAEYGEVERVEVNDPTGAGVDYDPFLGFAAPTDITLTVTYKNGKSRVLPLTAERLRNYSDLRSNLHGEQAVTVTSGGVEADSTVTVRVHKMSVLGRVTASCEKDGATGRAVCADCGLVYWESSVIPALGHSYEVYSSTEPTCTSMGQIRSRCTRCGARLDESIDRLPHTYGEGTVIREPTYTAEGTIRYRCTECGAVAEEAIPRLQTKLGDVDGDEKITAADARLALRRAVLLETFDEASPAFLSADVDGDRTVTASDARRILRAAVELEVLV